LRVCHVTLRSKKDLNSIVNMSIISGAPASATSVAPILKYSWYRHVVSIDEKLKSRIAYNGTTNFAKTCKMFQKLKDKTNKIVT
jgi:hypothetical protein